MVSDSSGLDSRHQECHLPFLLRPYVHTTRPDAGVVGWRMIPCDLCGADKPLPVLHSRGLDGPLVLCSSCGLYYVGSRRSSLTFGSDEPVVIAERVRQANQSFRNLRLEEEQRMAVINARSRLRI